MKEVCGSETQIMCGSSESESQTEAYVFSFSTSNEQKEGTFRYNVIMGKRIGCSLQLYKTFSLKNN